MMPDAPTHLSIHRRDYAPPAFLIDRVDLNFDLGASETRVRSRLAMRRNPARPGGGPLVLDGRKLALVAVLIDDRPLAPTEYAVDDDHLTIATLPDRFVLNVETVIRPQDNTELEGLYYAAGMFCTQCEAEGFRKITYFLDRQT